jgi:hypothetical protein
MIKTKNSKSIIILLILIIILNLVLRIPYSPNEQGRDSFEIQWMTQQIIDEEQARWIVHPSAIFGYFQYTYSSLTQFFTAICSLNGGVSVGTMILILDLIIAIVGLFSMFLFTKEFTQNDNYALISSLLFSTSGIFLKFTLWTSSTRHLFMAFLPLFFFFLIKYENTKNYRFLLLTIFFIPILMAIHRLSFYLIFIILPIYIISKSWFFIRDSNILNKKILDQLLIIILVFITIFLILIQFTNIDPINRAKRTYYDGILFDAGTIEDFENKNLNHFYLMLNLSIDYISKIGFIILFTPIFLLIKLRKINKNNYSVNELFIILVLISSLLLIMLGKYNTIFYLPIFILTGLIGFMYFLNLKYNIKLFKISLFLLIIISIISSVFINIYWITNNSKKTFLHDFELESIKFLLNQKNENIGIISDNENIGIHLQAKNTNFFYLGNKFRTSVFYTNPPLKITESQFRFNLKPTTDYFWYSDYNNQNYRKMNNEYKRLINKLPGYLEIIERYEIEYLLKQSNQNNQPNIFNDNNNQIYNNNELTIEHINII